MAQDVIKAKGSTRGSRPDSGGDNPRMAPIIGIVKDNIDPIRSGRLQVYLSDFGGKDSDDSSNWTTVSYMSPFFGSTEGSAPSTDYGSYKKNPTSYGMWTSPPDIGSSVICIFINGDPNFGYYIGSIPQPETLFMVPAIGSTDNVILSPEESSSFAGATRLPVTNLNTNNDALVDSSGFLGNSRPVHSYAASVLFQQGLLRDPIRGTIGSSSQRETPSRVGFGINTPGRPIYEGGYDDETIASNVDAGNEKLKITSRRAGHSIVMDDGDLIGRDQLVRLRTSTGHQILMSDDGQCLFIGHANGQSWIELGKEGTIDMYASNSVNIRTQGDLNLHADNDVNINAGNKIKMAAKDSVIINAEKDVVLRAGADFKQYAMGKYTIKVDGAMSFASGGSASLSSGAVTFINGSKINLNTGSASLVPEAISAIPVIKHTDAVYTGDKGWAAAPGALESIVTRATSHSPFAAAGKGVSASVDNSAESVTNEAPTPGVAASNAAATASAPDVKTVTPAVVSTVPATPAISSSIDKATSGALVGQAAVTAATGTAKNAVAAGAGIVGTGATATVSVGSFAALPTQLEASQVMKPGSAALADALAKTGKTITEAMPPALFTGQPGAENLSAFVANQGAQVANQATILQQAQATLTTLGVMTGKEAPAQIAGQILAATTQGASAVANAIKSGVSTPDISAAVSTGNFAANLGTATSGALNSITNGLSNTLSSITGTVGAAIDKITSAWKPMLPGVPQNLTALNPDAASAPAGVASGVNALSGGLSAVYASVGAAVSGVISKVSSTVTGAVAGIASGISAAGTAVLSAFGSGGAATSKLASLFEDTMKTRAAITDTTKKILGDIPAPNYNGNPATLGQTSATAAVDDIKQKQTQLANDRDLLDKASKKMEASQRAYIDAKFSLPPGDPSVALLEAEYARDHKAFIVEFDKQGNA